MKYSIIVIPVLGSILASYAQDSTQVEALIQSTKIISRNLEIHLEEEKSKKNAQAIAGEKGFKLEAANADYALSVGGLIQPFYQYYFGDKQNTGINQYSLRRSRLDIQSKLKDKLSARIQIETAPGASTVLQDAYAEWLINPFVILRAGRTNPSLGFEYSLPSAKTPFLDLSLVSNTLPNRDLGLIAKGGAINNAIEYQFGVFNGTIDGNRQDADTHDEKEFVGKISFTPTLLFDNPAAPTVLLATGVSLGKQFTAPASYRSPGRQKVFSYKQQDTLDGWQRRIVPSLAIYWNSFSSFAEASLQKVSLRDSLSQHQLSANHFSWQVTTSYILTGEDASFKGIRPENPLYAESQNWGAWELVGRIQVQQFDDTIFEKGFAAREKSIQKQASLGFGLNWYATGNLRIHTEYFATQFDGGAGSKIKVADRQTEHTLTNSVTVTF